MVRGITDIMDMLIMKGTDDLGNLWKKPITSLLVLSGLSVTAVTASEIELNATLELEGVEQQVKRDNDSDLSLQTFTVTPQISATFQSRKLAANLSASHTYLDRDNDALSQEDNYSNYQAQVSFTPFTRLLSFTASSSQSYRANTGSFINTDVISNSDNLAKIRNHAIGMDVSATEGDYISALFNASYTQIDVEQNESSAIAGIDSDNSSASIQLENGDEATFLLWSSTANYQKTKRDTQSYGDFESLNAAISADLMVTRWLGLRVSGASERYDTSSLDSAFSNTRKFDSYGVGITLKQSDVRRLSITWNDSNSSDDNNENDDTQQFLGADLLWSLSNRTSISAQFSRRFYGRSANADISYNSKYLRSSVQYTETVTNTSRLLANPESLGVFVCPVGVIDIAECQQPDSLEYTPDASETLVQFSQNVFELDDNIILRKALNGTIGYSFSKVNISLNLSSAEDNYIDNDRVRESDSADLTTSYALSRKTDLQASLKYLKVKDDLAVTDESATIQESNTKSASFTAKHALGQHFDTSLSFSYLKRSGDSQIGSIFGSNYSERKITVGLTYRYK